MHLEFRKKSEKFQMTIEACREKKWKERRARQFNRSRRFIGDISPVSSEDLTPCLPHSSRRIPKRVSHNYLVHTSINNTNSMLALSLQRIRKQRTCTVLHQWVH